jgi:hypothetical protein
MGDYVEISSTRQRCHSETRSFAQNEDNWDYVLKSRTWCKVLVIWSFVSTLACLTCAYYALDIRSTVLLNRELHNLEEIMVNVGDHELVGKHFRRARVLHRHGFYYNLARANKRSRNKGIRNRHFNVTSDIKHRSETNQNGKGLNPMSFSTKHPNVKDGLLEHSLENSTQVVDFTDKKAEAQRFDPEANPTRIDDKNSNRRKRAKKVLKDLIEVLADGAEESLSGENLAST